VFESHIPLASPWHFALPKDVEVDAFALVNSAVGGEERFFGLGCLRMANPAAFGAAIDDLRQRTGWRGEIAFGRVTKGSLPFYWEAIELLVKSADSYSCIIADRQRSDPVRRYGSFGNACHALSEQLLLHLVGVEEHLAVNADFAFPCTELCARVNHRLRRSAVGHSFPYIGGGYELPGFALTALLFEFLQAAGLAGATNAKAQLAQHLRETFGAGSCLEGSSGRLSVTVYQAP
jgi:hypothetical protein